MIKIPFSETTFSFRNVSKESVPMISKGIAGRVKGSIRARKKRSLSISSTLEATEKDSFNSLEKVCEFWKAPVTKFYANLVSLL